MSQTIAENTLLPVGEVARRLHASKKTVYRLAATGESPYVRVRGLIRFEPAEVAAFIEAHRKAA